MAVSVERAGPYTSPKVMADIISRHRARGLPMPINAENLARIGVSESLIPRTLASLETLDLITENGEITDTFEVLRLAPESEFKARMKEWLDAAYADVLQIADPASDNETAIHDAFRTYKPTGQRDRMVSLFLKLYAMAGIGSTKDDKPKARTRPSGAPKPAAAPKAAKPPQAGGSGTPPSGIPPKNGVPAAILGLLEDLPTDGKGWTAERRDDFLAAFGGVVKFLFPVTDSK